MYDSTHSIHCSTLYIYRTVILRTRCIPLIQYSLKIDEVDGGPPTECQSLAVSRLTDMVCELSLLVNWNIPTLHAANISAVLPLEWHIRNLQAMCFSNGWPRRKWKNAVHMSKSYEYYVGHSTKNAIAPWFFSRFSCNRALSVLASIHRFYSSMRQTAALKSRQRCVTAARRSAIYPATIHGNGMK